MSFRFVFGASGAGKSHYLREEIIQKSLRSKESLKERFYLVVPDQFTMQTQKEVVSQHPNGGILNIDVLSFTRLAHRVFEEMGSKTRLLLDDTGKNLIVRRVAASCEEELKSFSGKMHRFGMVSEVKSVLSEFMQYGIGEKELQKMIALAKERDDTSLLHRLLDLELLYRSFLQYEKDRFITQEETLQAVAEAIPFSEKLKGSVICFDGFTGFTPVQLSVLSAILGTAGEVTFSFLYREDGEKDPEEVLRTLDPGREEALFYLTRKSICDIARIAKEQETEHGKDVFLNEKTPFRFAQNPVLAHLERSLFVSPERVCPEKAKDALKITECADIEEEVRWVFQQMEAQIRKKNGAYRDFAILCGDVTAYAETLGRCAADYGIPVYLDETRSIFHNVLMRGIRAALEIRRSGFSLESVFSYLRSGLSALREEDVDRLENYCMRHGIRSKAKWSLPFDEETEEARKAFLAEVEPLLAAGQDTAGKTKALFFFLQNIGAEERLRQLSEKFSSEGELLLAREYEGVYKKVIELLEQIYDLMGEEAISQEDYKELLEAGFSELRVGVLPQSVDSVLIGDMERTRISGKKTVFFMGVNDGVVPRTLSTGGILSDYERELFLQAGIELAPTPRQALYRQRLYLYMNMTQPSENLFLSYALSGEDGSALRPSSLIGKLTQMFPDVSVQRGSDVSPEDGLFVLRERVRFLSENVRGYAEGRLRAEEEKRFLTVYALAAGMSDEERRTLLRITDAAFQRYEGKELPAECAQLLYGDRILGSITRLETMAQCEYRQFLQYGLRLKEREEYRIRQADTGEILHRSLQLFDEKLKKQGLSWVTVTEEKAAPLLSEALAETASSYKDLILYSTARETMRLTRLQRILSRTFSTLQYQLLQGSFTPAGAEVTFGETRSAGDLTFVLSGGRELKLIGRIDRYDVAEEAGRRYLKILDYKSGKKDLDPAKMREGLQLQLILYMEALRRMEEVRYKDREILPAALLYYRMDDPVLSEASEEARLKELRPKGLVRGDEEVLRLLDKDFTRESLVIPVQRNKDGSLSSRSHTFRQEEYDILLQDVQSTTKKLAENILDGRMAHNPRKLNAQTDSCTYCAYRNVCGFDLRIPGFRKREG
ncbi:MAG: PD-(D/E)XK nuclease family protein [Lachnospiraceae bacterium]|nr:PD-(D/E)XK nuclease family protein [Lachnospiraceae bacterium]